MWMWTLCVTWSHPQTMYEASLGCNCSAMVVVHNWLLILWLLYGISSFRWLQFIWVWWWVFVHMMNWTQMTFIVWTIQWTIRLFLSRVKWDVRFKVLKKTTDLWPTTNSLNPCKLFLLTRTVNPDREGLKRKGGMIQMSSVINRCVLCLSRSSEGVAYRQPCQVTLQYSLVLLVWNRYKLNVLGQVNGIIISCVKSNLLLGSAVWLHDLPQVWNLIFSIYLA